MKHRPGSETNEVGYPQPVADVHYQTLGRALVEAAHEVDQARDGPSDLLTRPIEAVNYRLLADTARSELATTRDRIAAFTPPQTTNLRNYMRQHAPERFREQLEAARETAQPWIDWLVGDSYESNRALFETLEWHVEQMNQLQHDPVVQSAILKHKDSFKEMIPHGIQSQLLSEYAEVSMDKIDDLTVYVGDPFDPVLAAGAAGYYDLASPLQPAAIVLSADVCKSFSGTTYDLEVYAIDTLWHELSHGVLETSYDTAYDPSEPWCFDFSLQESAIEHTVLVASEGEPDVLAPNDRRVQGKGAYLEIRRARAELMRGVSPRLMTRAMSGTCEEKQQFADAIDEAWRQENVLAHVADYVMKLAKEYDAALDHEPTNHWQSRQAVIAKGINRFVEQLKS